MTVDPRSPCVIGVGQRSWRPDQLDGPDALAPEPLAMWEDVARTAATDTGATSDRVLAALDSLQVVYCQSWQYDDPPGRLAERLGLDHGNGPDGGPRLRHYSGIGGTTPQVLLDDAATAMLRGELDTAMVVGAEALATKRRLKRAGEKPAWSHPEAERSPFPFEAPFHPAEVAHEVFQAWLTFAVFDVARRGHLGIDPDSHRRATAEHLARMSKVAARNPHAWFPIERSAQELATATRDNRMVGYPYTKREVAIMDIDQAAAVLLATHEAADRLGVPPERRVYLRGWCAANDATYVAEHDPMWSSPAMQAASSEALRLAGLASVDDIAHLDLYSCFASSIAFALDALGLGADDRRGVTVTGGLPFAGGPGSNYLSHAVATMTDRLRADPGSYGLVSGVGMHMTKHVYAVYGTEPPPSPVTPPDQSGVQAAVTARHPPRPIAETATGPATVAAYSVVHDRDNAPQWGLVVCDLPGGERCYARALDADLLASLEDDEWVGRTVELLPAEHAGNVNLAKAP